jgi:adenine-specific DNA-methyltransferase
MEKLKMHSPNFAEENIERLAELFPGCVTESTDEDGNLKKSIDWDLLKQELSTHIVEGPQERYRLDWPGKREALLTANAPIAKTLRPCREESVDFDTTENLFIEGDNLDALKLLQETYLGKVKMIYIDPPYNTGKDFIYKDDFKQSTEEYLQESEQKDEEGNRLVANTDSNGRFHSDWLSMMYSRLKLARNLLSDDGLIFVSIGPEEVNNLTNLMNEVFGETNYRNSIAIKRGAKSVQAQFETWDKLGTAFEYLLLYSKTATYRFPKMERELDKSKTGSWNNHWRGTDRPTMRYELFGITPESGQWRWGKDRSIQAIKNYQKLLSQVGKNENEITQDEIDTWYKKQTQDIDLLRLSSTGKPEHFIPPTNTTLLNDVWFHLPSGGSSVVKDLMGFKAFDNPKPLDLILQTCRFCSDDAIILDFFAGSATTAHAVMQLNAEDGGKRKFIMVQLPEETDEKSEAFKAGYKTIAEISKERIRRAGKKIKEENATTASNLDIGFRVLKVDSSNMADVYYSPDAVEQNLLSLLTDNIKDDRTAEDLLFQVLLDWGVDLTLPITKETIEGREVFLVDGNALAACFVKNGEITEDFCKELAKRQPLRVVFRDSGFKDDSVKINVEQIFKLMSPHTDVKTI